MEHARSTSHGGFSVRSIFVLVFTVIVTVFLWAILVSTPTHAADPASWRGDAIIYQEKAYSGPVDEQTLRDLGLDTGVKAYVFVDPEPSRDSTNTSSNSSPPTRKIHVIYFDMDGNNLDGVNNLSDVTTAKYRDYTYVAKGNYKNPSATEQISISPKTDTGLTSCAIDGGLGWIICPVTNTLATAMDAVYGFLSGFLSVRPIETGQDNALYRSWKFMQGFANIAFMIVFLIIIYSQLTSVGIGSYGIKKLLPRLIIAALLVNVSYFICSIAVDVSNILGYSLQDLFMNLRGSLVGAEGNGWETWSGPGGEGLNWTSLAGFVLSGGTALVGGGTAAFLAVSDFSVALIWLILPALVIALLSVLVALLIMAARQAIIVILVILAPLAFVAYLLPNTEKWFEKWRDTFITMLFLFPAFSVVFGGSQVAAMVIIQSADSINLIILGMLVQVAPLIITPLLVRLGGSLLARIAGIVNDPKRGIIDRARNLSKDRMENNKARRIGTPLSTNRVLSKAQFLKRNAQWRDAQRRKREGWKETHTGMADARWANSDQYRTINQASRYASEDKAEGEAVSEAMYEESRVSSDRVRTLDTRTRTTQERINAAKSAAETQWEDNNAQAVLESRIKARAAADTLESAKKRFESQYNDFKGIKAGEELPERFRNVPNVLNYHTEALEAIRENDIHTSRISNAQAQQRQNFAEELKESVELREQAGGILEHGAVQALAAANATIDNALTEAIKNIQSTSTIAAGKVDELEAALDEAINSNDLASTVAYTNKLAESQNIGVHTLRQSLRAHEENGSLTGDLLKNLKQFVNENNTINVAAEDIGTWSRDPDNRTLVQVAATGAMWHEMTPQAFAAMKKSSQFEAMWTPDPTSDTGFAVTRDMAKEILNNPTARGQLKQSVLEDLLEIKDGRRPTRDKRLDPPTNDE